MRPHYHSGTDPAATARSQLLHRPARCYHRRQRWNHKKNSNNCSPGKKPSSRSSRQRKKELQDAQRRQKDNLQKQIHRAQARLSSAERKQRTRRLILLGSYLEHVTGDDPAKRDSLMQGLDVFLERDRDRELFDLPHKENANGNTD